MYLIRSLSLGLPLFLSPTLPLPGVPGPSRPHDSPTPDMTVFPGQGLRPESESVDLGPGSWETRRGPGWPYRDPGRPLPTHASCVVSVRGWCGTGVYREGPELPSPPLWFHGFRG